MLLLCTSYVISCLCNTQTWHNIFGHEYVRLLWFSWAFCVFSEDFGCLSQVREQSGTRTWRQAPAWLEFLRIAWNISLGVFSFKVGCLSRAQSVDADERRPGWHMTSALRRCGLVGDDDSHEPCVSHFKQASCCWQQGLISIFMGNNKKTVACAGWCPSEIIYCCKSGSHFLFNFEMRKRRNGTKLRLNGRVWLYICSCNESVFLPIMSSDCSCYYYSSDKRCSATTPTPPYKQTNWWRTCWGTSTWAPASPLRWSTSASRRSVSPPPSDETRENWTVVSEKPPS